MDSALNRPVDDWGKLLGDTAAVSSMLDRLLHHGHVLQCGPRSWRTKTAAAVPVEGLKPGPVTWTLEADLGYNYGLS